MGGMGPDVKRVPPPHPLAKTNPVHNQKPIQFSILLLDFIHIQQLRMGWRVELVSGGVLDLLWVGHCYI